MYHSTTKIGRGEWNRCPHTLFSLEELRVTHNVRTVQPNILDAAFGDFDLCRRDRRARWTVRAPDWAKSSTKQGLPRGWSYYLVRGDSEHSKGDSTIFPDALF